MPKGSARVPRPLDPNRLTGRQNQRIRRLEINRNLPLAGTAGYAKDDYSLSPANSWTPDFSTATVDLSDQIGLSPSGSGVLVPQGWIVWAAVIIEITISDPPTGEALLWVVGVGEGPGSQRSDVLFGGTQDFTTDVIAPSGWASANQLPITVQMSTALGTVFTPSAMAINAVGIQLPVGGFPTGIIE